MSFRIKKVLILVTLLAIYFPFSVLSIEPKNFIQSTVDQASNILSDEISNDQKIKKLKSIAKESVDVEGIGFYTLGKYRKSLTEDQKKRYSELFEEYFLKSFSSRLVEYTNPQINVDSQEVLNKNYTIVNSTLKGTDKRPEIKIDWRVYTKIPEKPLIRDLIIEGLSLARTQKEEFSSIINSNNGDIDSLLKTLEDFAKD
jgi:phospholipid transport system substrate-binding protein